MFLSPDLHFFITHKALKLAEDNELLLSLLVSHELAHYLLDHQIQKVLNGFFYVYCYKKLFPSKDWREHEEIVVHDPLKNEFEDKIYLQNFSDFYPNKQRISNKFYERNCDALAVKLWKSVYGKSDNEPEGSEKLSND